MSNLRLTLEYLTGLTLSYLYYHLFGDRWSSTASGNQHGNSFNLFVKQLRLSRENNKTKE